MGDEQLFGRVAHLDRVVDHQRRWVDVLEEMRRRDIGHVEGRVLAHQDDVHGGEIDAFGCAERRVTTFFAPHRQPACASQYAAVMEHQILGQVVVQRVAPALRLQGEDEGRVGVDVDVFDRVHLNRDGKAHESTKR